MVALPSRHIQPRTAGTSPYNQLRISPGTGRLDGPNLCRPQFAVLQEKRERRNRARSENLHQEASGTVPGPTPPDGGAAKHCFQTSRAETAQVGGSLRSNYSTLAREIKLYDSLIIAVSYIPLTCQLTPCQRAGGFSGQNKSAYSSCQVGASASGKIIFSGRWTGTSCLCEKHGKLRQQGTRKTRDGAIKAGKKRCKKCQLRRISLSARHLKRTPADAVVDNFRRKIKSGDPHKPESTISATKIIHCPALVPRFDTLLVTMHAGRSCLLPKEPLSSR